jgi:hypothetical protein
MLTITKMKMVSIYVGSENVKKWRSVIEKITQIGQINCVLINCWPFTISPEEHSAWNKAEAIRPSQNLLHGNRAAHKPSLRR